MQPEQTAQSEQAAPRPLAPYPKHCQFPASAPQRTYQHISPNNRAGHWRRTGYTVTFCSALATTTASVTYDDKVVISMHLCAAHAEEWHNRLVNRNIAHTWNETPTT